MSARTLWVSSVGTASAFGLVAAARRCLGNDVRIIGADTNPAHLVAASRMCDEFEQTREVADSEFPARLLGLLDHHAVDYYVAMLDTELVVSAGLVEEGKLDRIACNAPPLAVAELCIDKLATHEWLEANGFPSPRTVSAADAVWTGTPLFCKPRSGFGSHGVFRIGSEKEFEAVQLSGSCVIQEVCEGPEVTLDLFRPANGSRVEVMCRERVETKAGVCTKARFFRDGVLEAIGARLADELDLRGAACVQLMHSKPRGTWVLTDVNPRPGSGTPMCFAIGVDLLGAMVLDGLGIEESIDLEPLATGTERFVVRNYQETELVAG